MIITREDVLERRSRAQREFDKLTVKFRSTDFMDNQIRDEWHYAAAEHMSWNRVVELMKDGMEPVLAVLSREYSDL